VAQFEAVVIAGTDGEMSDAIGPVMSTYPVINYADESRSLRLQTFDYVSTSGELNCLQMKPNVSVGGTTGITCIELSPRFADGIAGSKLVCLKCNPDLKGSSGNLTSDVRCIEAKFDGGTGRTVAGYLYILHAMTANAATVTGGCFVIGVDAAGGGGTGWTGFVRFAATGAGGCVLGATMAKDPNDDDEAGYITIYVGSTAYQVAFWASA